MYFGVYYPPAQAGKFGGKKTAGQRQKSDQQEHMHNAIKPFEFEAFLLFVEQSIGQQGGQRKEDSCVFDIRHWLKTRRRFNQAPKSAE